MTDIAAACSGGSRSASPEAKPVMALPMLGDVRFHNFVRRRRVFSYALASAMLVAYFAFILLIAYAPGALGTRIVTGHPTTWGIPIGLGMLAFTFALVAIYVHRANTVYDVMLADIRCEEQS
ncbi:DUF485 domain-containing protein [Trinickia sp. EG282A]|uniref:DUF485 domain-containing protein n=1 Tax=Trinickia sp. EG282A TaxID=3237013 RepID=UPI0034D1A7D0